MRAFLTGGSGFIGSRLIDALLRDGWRVAALSHRTLLRQASDVEVIAADITDLSALESGMRAADVVFHLASALGSSLIGREEFFRINAAGTKAVLEAGRRARVSRVVHFSSAGIFGSVKNGDVADEDYPARPILPYDQAKHAGEQVARRYAAEGMDVVILRPGWAYGPGDRRTFKLIRMVVRGPFVMPAGGAARQTPVYISDLVEGAMLAAARGRAGEVYHLAGSAILTAAEIIRAVASAAGRELPRFGLPGGPARLAAYILEKAFLPLHREPPLNRPKLSFFLHSKPLSIAKARRELGYSPGVDFAAGIRTALDWYRRNGWL
jgi:nucleoside-diphosphate-sugar epimerase